MKVSVSSDWSAVHRGLCAAVLACVLAGCGSNEPLADLPPPMMPVQDVAAPRTNDEFKAGDRLELMVEEDSTFNGNYEVRPEGYVLIPKLGRVPVVGLTRVGAEKRVKEYLERSQLKQATVFVERSALPGAVVGSTPQSQLRMMLFLTGKVNRPGQHFVPVPNGHKLGLYEAVLVTGGTAKFADESKVQVMRLDASGMRRPSVVNMKRIREGTDPDVPVGEGDIINIPEKGFGF
ncbi:MAG: polysaccharide biosynthesis/export family protein [Verrucomicrobiales bacterium]|nr:polysaccharide biosynthesis/export family protein [Verrucomicrobiales bacterium]MCP5559306.1 polysaccharide biosynthesis/export family protein [Verrucomicrobiaceae bacterium]